MRQHGGHAGVEAIAVVERQVPDAHAGHIHERIELAGGEAPDGITQLA